MAPARWARCGTTYHPRTSSSSSRPGNSSTEPQLGSRRSTRVELGRAHALPAVSRSCCASTRRARERCAAGWRSSLRRSSPLPFGIPDLPLSGICAAWSWPSSPVIGGLCIQLAAAQADVGRIRAVIAAASGAPDCPWGGYVPRRRSSGGGAWGAAFRLTLMVSDDPLSGLGDAGGRGMALDDARPLRRATPGCPRTRCVGSARPGCLRACVVGLAEPAGQLIRVNAPGGHPAHVAAPTARCN